MEPFNHVIRGKELYFRHSYGLSVRSDREFHPFHEIVYFLHGNTLFLSDSVSRMLEEKTLVLIPKETYHQFSFLSDPEDYHRCVFQFYDSPSFAPPAGSMREIRILPCSEGLEYAIDLLTRKADRDPTQDCIPLVQAVLLLILYGAGEEGTGGGVSTRSPKLEAALAYIEKHLPDPLRVPDIAADCGLSDSGLAHLFSAELQISVHRYILNKRLAVAYNKILGGASPVRAAKECGFADYSGFYRQFRKRFDTSPSRIQDHRFEP